MEFDGRVITTTTPVCPAPFVLWYIFNSTQAQTWTLELSSSLTFESYSLVGPIPYPELCSSMTIDIGDMDEPAEPDFISQPVVEGWYVLAIEFSACQGTIELLPHGLMTCPGCEDCIPSFAPLHEGTYIVNAWCMDESAGPLTIHYTTPKLSVFGSAAAPLGSWGPSGPIIDGWQRIEGLFTVPPDAERIKILLESTSGNVLFDDIRVFPADGSLKCYVYDPLQQRLMAELDERHFATIYEYDQEGQLTRIKKETERGVMTVQEQRANNSKLSNP